MRHHYTLRDWLECKNLQNQRDIDHPCMVEYEKIKLQNRRHTKETVITCNGKYQGHAGIIYWLTARLPNCRAIMHVNANSNVNSTSRNWPRSWKQHLKAKVESEIPSHEFSQSP